MLQLTLSLFYECLGVNTYLSRFSCYMHLESLLSFGQNFGQTMQQSNHSLLPGSAGRGTTKNKADSVWLNTFMPMRITINPTQYNQMLHNGYILVELRRLVYAL